MPKRGLFISYINKVLCIYSLCKAHICHGYHGLCPWRKNCQMEKFWEMLEKFGETLGNYGEILGKILRNFATIYALSCAEKLSPKVHLWRKITNMRSAVASNNNIGIVGVPERFGRKRITVMSYHRPNVVWHFVKYLPFAIQSAILT